MRYRYSSRIGGLAECGGLGREGTFIAVWGLESTIMASLSPQWVAVVRVMHDDHTTRAAIGGHEGGSRAMKRGRGGAARKRRSTPYPFVGSLPLRCPLRPFSRFQQCSGVDRVCFRPHPFGIGEKSGIVRWPRGQPHSGGFLFWNRRKRRNMGMGGRGGPAVPALLH